MQLLKAKALVFGFLLLFWSNPVFSKENTMKSEKKAILIAAFGTTVANAAEAYQRLDASAKARFPGREVRWAYTSKMVRKKLATRGDAKESVSEGLAHLARDGYKSIAVLPLQVIPGVEFHLIRQDVSSFLRTAPANGMAITVGNPLLSGYEDAVRVAQALISEAPKERKSTDAVVFMGHGSGHHPSDLFYVAMASILREKDPLAFLGTVEGHPTLEDIVKKCTAAGCARAWLIPFMAVAGYHAGNDMAGDEEDSWKSVLEREGIACTPVLRGGLDCPGIRDVWLDHLAQIVG